MKVTRRQIRRIIRESMTPGKNIEFEWTPDGLAMKMLVDGNEVTSFSTQKEVSALITQLEELLAGPMRTSP